MDISTRRINYILDTRSQTWLANAIGVSQSTISRIHNNISSLAREFRDTLRNVYQREAYANLRSSGSSATEARRFSWYIPETVIDIESTFEEVRNMLEVTWIANKSRKEGVIYTADEIEDLLNDARPSILKSLQKSKKTIEEIYASGKKKLFV